MKFVYIFVRVCVHSGPRSASFEQMTSASFVVVDIVERERRREETKGLSVKFHVSFVTRVSFFSSF